MHGDESPHKKRTENKNRLLSEVMFFTSPDVHVAIATLNLLEGDGCPQTKSKDG
jgi:hypothetical protein